MTSVAFGKQLMFTHTQLHRVSRIEGRPAVRSNSA